DFDNRRALQSPGEPRTMKFKIRHIGVSEYSAVCKCHPDERYMVFNGLLRIVSATLESQCHSTDVIQIFEHCSVQLFLDPQKDSYRKCPGKPTVSQRVADRRKGKSAGGS